MPTSEVSIEQLSEHTADVLRRVEAGERIRVVDERRSVVAELGPASGDARRTWVTRDELMESFVQADPGLRADLDALYRDTAVDG